MYTEKDFSKLLSEVENEFSAFLAKAETQMAKSEDESTEKKDEDTKPEAKDEAPVSQEAAPAEKQDEAAPAQDAAPEANAEQAPADDQAAPAQAEEGHGYDDEDMKHMQEMYASMSKSELIAHHDAVRAALDNCGMAKCGEQQAAPAPEAQAQESMIKSEKDVVVEVKPEVIQTSQETEILKSEVAAKTAEVEKLNKTLEAVTAFVTKLVETKGAPQGKAITHLETIAKSEEIKSEKTFTKQEITAKLSSKASEPTLTKSDREAINQFYATGQININGISHLLK